MCVRGPDLLDDLVVAHIGRFHACAESGKPWPNLNVRTRSVPLSVHTRYRCDGLTTMHYGCVRGWVRSIGREMPKESATVAMDRTRVCCELAVVCGERLGRLAAHPAHEAVPLWHRRNTQSARDTRRDGRVLSVLKAIDRSAMATAAGALHCTTALARAAHRCG